MSVKVIRFEELKKEYLSDEYFGPIYIDLQVNQVSPYTDFSLKDGYLFYGNQLCLPNTSIHDFVVWKLHSRGLAGNFGIEETTNLV